MAENSPITPQVKHNSWQQMHDGLFWPRYDPLLPGRQEVEREMDLFFSILRALVDEQAR